MNTDEPVTFQEHQRRAVNARWAKTTPEERRAYAKKMVEAREAKRRKQEAQAAFDGLHGEIILICSVCRHRHRPRCSEEHIEN